MRSRPLLAALLAVVASASACQRYYLPPPDASGTAPTPVPVAVQHTVEYRVLGTVPLADITYGSAQDGTTMTETSVPWSSAFKTTRTSLFVYLKAESSFSGTITAQIFVDGQLFREASNNFLGSTNVADASGTVTFSQ